MSEARPPDASRAVPLEQAPAFAHRDADVTVAPEAVAFVVGPALLARGASKGPLHGTTFAVKDLIDVAGTRTGCGNPDRLADAAVASAHAPVVTALLDAGSDCMGKTLTDEFAFSLSGTNVHYGTPANPAAPGRVPGGSSSGSASAVAAGRVDLALGTDTGGSVRVPASYCGIWGIRTTHGRVDVRAVAPLSPSFDTVGLFTRDPVLLATALGALLSGAPGALASGSSSTPTVPRTLRRLVVAGDLLALADGGEGGGLAEAIAAEAARLGSAAGIRVIEARLAGGLDELAEWREAFRTIQMLEANASNGAWLAARRPRLGPGIAARFAAAAELDASGRDDALANAARARDRLVSLLGDDGVLVQPAASGPAPLFNLDAASKDDLRTRTLTLTAPAGLAGAPVVVAPAVRTADGPVGLALVGLPGDDEALVVLAGVRR